MAADKILMLTQAGLDLELNLPVSGGEYPRMQWLVICMGVVLATESAVQSMTEWPEAWEVKIPLGGVKRFDNNTGARLLGHILATQSLPTGKKITGIGVELENGMKYGYTPYYQSIGGLPKPDGLALTLEIILAKTNSVALSVQYAPYDSDLIATQVVESALKVVAEQTASRLGTLATAQELSITQNAAASAATESASANAKLTVVEQQLGTLATAQELSITQSAAASAATESASANAKLTVVEQQLGNLPSAVVPVGGFGLFAESAVPSGYALPGAKLPVADYGSNSAINGFDFAAPSFAVIRSSLPAAMVGLPTWSSPVGVSDDGQTLFVNKTMNGSGSASAYSIDGGLTWNVLNAAIYAYTGTYVVIKNGVLIDVFYAARGSTGNKAAIRRFRVDTSNNTAVDSEIYLSMIDNGVSGFGVSGLYKIGGYYYFGVTTAYDSAICRFKLCRTADFVSFAYSASAFSSQQVGLSFNESPCFAMAKSADALYLIASVVSNVDYSAKLNIYKSTDNGVNWSYVKQHVLVTNNSTFYAGFGATSYKANNKSAVAAIVGDYLLTMGAGDLVLVALDANVTGGYSAFGGYYTGVANAKWQSANSYKQNIGAVSNIGMLLRSGTVANTQILPSNESSTFAVYDAGNGVMSITRGQSDFKQNYEVPYLAPPNGGVYAMKG